MTTDTFPKVATARVKLGKATVTICGIAKGAGMIAPDMATMLSFVFTDAPISASALQAIVSGAVIDTFNAVTIDGDTSTSDTLLAFATGAAKGAPQITSAGDPRLKAFREGFATVLANLSEQAIHHAPDKTAGTLIWGSELGDSVPPWTVLWRIG